jgi:hypothetical protein
VVFALALSPKLLICEAAGFRGASDMTEFHRRRDYDYVITVSLYYINVKAPTR